MFLRIGRKGFMRVFEVIALVISFTSLFSSMYLWLYYAGTRPSVAQPDAGRIYPLNTHGFAAYLTEQERFWL